MGDVRNLTDIFPAAKGRRIVATNEDGLFRTIQCFFQCCYIVEIRQLDIAVTAPALVILEVLAQLEVRFIVDDDGPWLYKGKRRIEGFQAAVAENNFPGAVELSKLFFRLGDGRIMRPLVARRFRIDDVEVDFRKHQTTSLFLSSHLRMRSSKNDWRRTLCSSCFS